MILMASTMIALITFFVIFSITQSVSLWKLGGSPSSAIPSRWCLHGLAQLTLRWLWRLNTIPSWWCSTMPSWWLRQWWWQFEKGCDNNRGEKATLADGWIRLSTKVFRLSTIGLSTIRFSTIRFSTKVFTELSRVHCVSWPSSSLSLSASSPSWYIIGHYHWYCHCHWYDRTCIGFDCCYHWWPDINQVVPIQIFWFPTQESNSDPPGTSKRCSQWTSTPPLMVGLRCLPCWSPRPQLLSPRSLGSPSPGSSDVAAMHNDSHRRKHGSEQNLLKKTFELCLFKESWWWAATTTGAPVCGCLLQIGMYRSIFGFLPPGGLWGRVRAGF